MLNFNWIKTDLLTKEDIYNMFNTYKECKARFSAWDTETSGLHLKEDKPFVISFGFIDTENLKGYSYTFDLENTPALLPIFVKAMYTIAKKTDKFIAQNVKFDMHMMANIGYEYPGENLSDLRIVIRLAHDAIPQGKGGVSLALKTYAARHVDPRAKSFEQKLTYERKRIRVDNTRRLKRNLASIPVDPHYQVTGTERRWTMRMIDKFFGDKINDIEDLPTEISDIIKEWNSTKTNPEKYFNYNRENVLEYAHYDVIYLLEAYWTAYQVTIARKQETTLEREERLIKPLWAMERVGYLFNMEYALKSKEIVKNYIKQQREYLHQLAGQSVTVGQHALIKNLLNEKFNFPIAETGKKKLIQALKDRPNKEAEKFIKVVSELRTLEKWYSTYICRWIDIAKQSKDGRVYTQYNQTGAVSGRVSSDFQQFPGKELENYKGDTMFTPRRMFKTTPGYHTYYLDYNAMEVRLQALYTIKVMGGDDNLCRLYYPHNMRIEDWVPGNLHNLTTCTGFNITENHPDFQKLRKAGKSANFAMIYGANINTLMNQFGFDEDTATKLYNGFYGSFPGIADYARWVKSVINQQGYITNMLGRKYYGISAHNARNYLIQGTGADFTKEKIIDVHNFLKGYKSRAQGYVHDEISFEIAKGEEFLLPKLKEIMEQWDGSPITMEVDLEISKTTWDAKSDYKL